MVETLVNFADQLLYSKINCSAITVDGCDVTNLIDCSNKSFSQANHFMAEYFIKCPVEIILTFPCLVDISAIIVQPKVSSHSTKAFDILTVYQKPMIKENYHSIYPCHFYYDFSNHKIREHNRSMMSTLARYKTINTDSIPDKIVFRNSHHKVPYSILLGDNVVERDLWIGSSVSSCSHLILKLTWATIPVIKKLEVWGTLSRFNPKNIETYFSKLLNKLNYEAQIKTKNMTTICLDNAPPSIDVLNVDIVPNEFLDPITCNIMTVPMLLPSGNTVDIYTLEKYFEEESKHGRLPSDPFTGVVFLNKQKPVANTSLKSRIDEFLLSENIVNGYQTSSKSHSPNNYTPKSHNPAITSKGNISSVPSNFNAIHETHLVSNNRNKRKLINVEENLSRNMTKFHKKDNSNSSLDANKLHENHLKKSLDDELFATLSLLPVKSLNEQISPCCCSCSWNDPNKLLILPCSHLFCRKCIMGATRCASCNSFFKRSEVKKYI